MRWCDVHSHPPLIRGKTTTDRTFQNLLLWTWLDISPLTGQEMSKCSLVTFLGTTSELRITLDEPAAAPGCLRSYYLTMTPPYLSEWLYYYYLLDSKSESLASYLQNTQRHGDDDFGLVLRVRLSGWVVGWLFVRVYLFKMHRPTLALLLRLCLSLQSRADSHSVMSMTFFFIGVLLSLLFYLWALVLLSSCFRLLRLRWIALAAVVSDSDLMRWWHDRKEELIFCLLISG